MSVHRTEAKLSKEGTLVLTGLPFHAGEEVEVIILSRSKQTGVQDRYSLRGKPIRYVDPFESVAQEDW
jgi:hypothetical protein